MLCSNCGKNEANIRYTRIINGEKTEYSVCEDCAKKLGIDDIDFNMPISFSNFLSDFFDDEPMLPSFAVPKISKCPKCGLTFEEFAESGRLGCGECYTAFGNKIDSVLRNLHGTSKHKGRAPKNILNSSKNTMGDDGSKKSEKINLAHNPANVDIPKKIVNEKQNKIDELNKELQLAIKEERYEDAAKIRDEIKGLQ